MLGCPTGSVLGRWNSSWPYWSDGEWSAEGGMPLILSGDLMPFRSSRSNAGWCNNGELSQCSTRYWEVFAIFVSREQQCCVTKRLATGAVRHFAKLLWWKAFLCLVHASCLCDLFFFLLSWNISRFHLPLTIFYIRYILCFNPCPPSQISSGLSFLFCCFQREILE